MIPIALALALLLPSPAPDYLCQRGTEPGIINQDNICVTIPTYEAWYSGNNLQGYADWVWALWWPWKDALTGKTSDYDPTLGVQQWKPLVEQYFPSSQVNNALSVMACESAGNPTAHNSSDPQGGAKGLFQHLSNYFPSRATAAGFAGASPYDPEANVAAAAWLWSQSGWSPWTCARIKGIR